MPGEREAGRSCWRKGSSAVLQNCLDCPVPPVSSLAPDTGGERKGGKKTKNKPKPENPRRADRDGPAGRSVQLIRAGRAREAVLGRRVCTPPRWCFETVSASFLQPRSCVGIASCWRNVFPVRRCLAAPPPPPGIGLRARRGCVCARSALFSTSPADKECMWLKYGENQFTARQ